MNNRYQPYRMQKFGSGNTQCGAGRTSPYSNMTSEELGKLSLAMAYVPWQSWGDTYDSAKALCRGTIFPPLDLPFGFGG